METKADKENVNSFLVGSVPTVIYLPDFITDEEEQHLLNTIYTAPVSKWKVLKNRRLQNWGGIVHEKGLLAQDLPTWLTRITARIYEKSGLFPSAINHVLINEYLPDQGIMPHQDGPAYFPVVAILSLGSPVVMDFTPHPSLQLSTEPLENKETQNNTANEGPMLMNTDRSSDKHPPFSVVLIPRSLLIFKDEAYSDYLHGIKDQEYQQFDKAVNIPQITKSLALIQSAARPEEEIDRNETRCDKLIHRTATRISLTCRVVTKVQRNLFKF
ncbi:alkylated DNA repair protein ALKBH6 homolog isoform X2 [Coffea arabica]|uniref:Alkylated DNA repair protein ALKBH6 homolog isoform X2 n=1 Tax=Coffea arabica TaxID=13443 RepID=A0ABM4UT27_COFAR